MLHGLCACLLCIIDLFSNHSVFQGGYGLDVDHQKAGDHYQQAGDSAMEAMKGKLASKYYMAAEESWALVE